MELLLVTATKAEMEAIPVLSIQEELKKKGINLHQLITRPGMICTAYEMGKILATRRFDVALNAGIAGSFTPSLEVGSVVQVTREILADFGAEDNEDFLSAFELGLLRKDEFPFAEGMLNNAGELENRVISGLPSVTGITVDKVHGNDLSIQKIRFMYNPDVESMEGGAFFYACMMHEVPFAEIRAISNRVEKRNRDHWNIPHALSVLGSTVINIIRTM
jgi:futalosine hydrolase